MPNSKEILYHGIMTSLLTSNLQSNGEHLAKSILYKMLSKA